MVVVFFFVVVAAPVAGSVAVDVDEVEDVDGVDVVDVDVEVEDVDGVVEPMPEPPMVSEPVDAVLGVVGAAVDGGVGVEDVVVDSVVADVVSGAFAGASEPPQAVAVRARAARRAIDFMGSVLLGELQATPSNCRSDRVDEVQKPDARLPRLGTAGPGI